MQKSVVILGATGLVGSTLVEELILDQQVSEIRILTRRPLVFTSEKIKHPNRFEQASTKCLCKCHSLVLLHWYHA